MKRTSFTAFVLLMGLLSATHIVRAQTWENRNALKLVLPSNANDPAKTLTIKAPTITGSSFNWILPDGNGAGLLQNDGSGNLSWTNGIVNPMTTLGDLIYGGASGTATRLTGQTTIARAFLSQPETGGTAAAPAWYDLFGSANSWTAAQTAQRDNIGTTSTDGVVLANSMAATSGQQQFSPRLRLTGQGWKSNASATSQAVDWIMENVPSTGGTTPNTRLIFSTQADAGGYNPVLTLSSGIEAYPSMTVKGAFGQTSHLQDWSNSSGSVLAYVDKDGNFSAAGLSVTGDFNITGRYMINSTPVLQTNGTLENFIIGYASAPIAAVTGIHNTLIGNVTAPSLGLGSFNTFIGQAAGTAASNDSGNTFVGEMAGFFSTSDNNTFIGAYAGQNTTTGDSNTFIGNSSGPTNTTGKNNTLFGYKADVGSNNLTNATALGYGASVSASNTIELGNTSVTAVNTSGTYQIGAANVLSATTLGSSVVNSSLTSVGTLGSLAVTNAAAADIFNAITGFRIGNAAASGNFLRGNGTNFVSSAIQSSDLPGSFAGFANPTASVGLSAVNGSAATAMRSDAAPALDQTIAPMWTGAHVFAPSSGTAVAITIKGSATSGDVIDVQSSNAGSTWLKVDHAGLTTLAGGLTVSSGAVTLPSTSIANSALQGSGALSVSAGTGLSGGGSVALGSSTSLSLDQAVSPTWTGAHIFAPSSGTAVAMTIKGSATSGDVIDVQSSNAGSTWLKVDHAGLTTLAGGLTVSGSSAISLGSGTGTFQVSSTALNVSTLGSVSGATTVTASTGISAPLFQGADASAGTATTFRGGNGSSTTGGSVTLQGGTATSGAGGSVTITAQPAAIAGSGGAVTIHAGAAVGVSGVAGAITETAGAGAPAVTTVAATQGGTLSVVAGVGGAGGTTGASAVGGDATLQSGAGGAAGSSTGNASIGGTAKVLGGTGGAAAAGTGTAAIGGVATVQGGTGGAGSATATNGAVGGNVNITGGAGGAANGAGTTGDGGDVVISGGLAAASAGTGGDIIFKTASTATGTTLTSRMVVSAGGPVLQSKSVAAASGATNLTAAQLIGGIITFSGGNANLTMPLASSIIGAIPGATTGLAFEFTIVNGGTGNATLVTNTGITLPTSTNSTHVVSTANKAGTFLVLVTGASTVALYRK